MIMNEIATITNLSSRGSVVAQLIDMDALERGADEIIRVLDQIEKLMQGNTVVEYTLGNTIGEYYKASECEEALERIAKIEISEKHLQPIMHRIGDGLKSADDKSIRQQLAFLLGAFPASTAPDPQVYSRVMIAEVSAAQPSLHALDTACRNLRRSLRWPPSIGEVLSSLEEAEAKWSRRYSAVQALSKRHAEAVAKLTDERNRLAKVEAEKRGALEAQITELEVELKAVLGSEVGSCSLWRSSHDIQHEIDRVKYKLSLI
jgi:hypothetical protein